MLLSFLPATGAIWRCNCRADAAEREETIVRLRRADLENRVVGGSEGGQDGLIFPGPLSFTRSVSQRFDERSFQAFGVLDNPTSRDNLSASPGRRPPTANHEVLRNHPM